jgi:hypothetical protein
LWSNRLAARQEDPVVIEIDTMIAMIDAAVEEADVMIGEFHIHFHELWTFKNDR